MGVIDRLAGRIAAERRKRTIREFHKLYYGSSLRTWKNTRWLGATAYKTPLDLWIYQELIFSVRPELIIETGTADGGSALFLATVCDAVGAGQIITIDAVGREGRPSHERVTYLEGSSTSPEVLRAVAKRARGKSPVMVILDSDHSREHVLDELRRYADYVTPGSYLVVEDTNLNDHPVMPGFGPGPAEAVREFLGTRNDFQSDPEREKFLLTFNPGGYLRRAPLPQPRRGQPSRPESRPLRTRRARRPSRALQPGLSLVAVSIAILLAWVGKAALTQSYSPIWRSVTSGWGGWTLGVPAAVATACLLGAALFAAIRRDDTRAVAGFIPDCLVFIARLLADAQVPRRRKLLLLFLLGYLALPIDPIPDVIPVVGQLDDVLVFGLVMRHVLRTSGEPLLWPHWPGPDASLRLVRRLARA